MQKNDKAGKAVAWVGVGLGFVAKVIMATHPNVAVVILIVATMLSAFWAIRLKDKQSFVLHSTSVILQINTLLYWSKGIGLIGLLAKFFQ